MIGANGTGKTSVLDVLSLLASSAQARLGSSISELGGLANVLTYEKAEELGLGITMEVPGHDPLEYSLWLRPQGIAHAIREETLSQKRKSHTLPFYGNTTRWRVHCRRFRRCSRSPKISDGGWLPQPFITC
jgi:predicted ATPase